MTVRSRTATRRRQKELNDIEFHIDGYREARLDHVIAQELHADFEFAEWIGVLGWPDLI